MWSAKGNPRKLRCANLNHLCARRYPAAVMTPAPTVALNGAERMLWRGRLKCGHGAGLVARSARCSFPTAHPAYREVKRILKPEGHFLFNVWDRIEENVFADDVTNALAEIFPNDPPRFLARTPHGYHDTALIRSELEDTGFSRVVIDTKADQSRASSPRLPAVAYCQGTLLRHRNRGLRATEIEVA